MRRLIVGAIGFVFAASCGQTEIKVEEKESVQKEEVVEVKVEEVVKDTTFGPGGFDYKSLKIQKGQLGKIKVGMTISEAENYLKDLSRKECDAYSFGFDGGGLAYLYSFHDEPILALVPERETDTILVIVATSPKLFTTNGLNPNSRISELLKVYPNMNTYRDLMMSWEFSEDSINDWDFVFMTGTDKEVSKYKELESPGIPVRLDEKTSWITIR